MSRSHPSFLVVAMVAAGGAGLALLAAACSSGHGSTVSGASATTAGVGSADSPACTVSLAARSEQPKGHPTGHLRVLAAASLTEAFQDLGRRFEAANPGSRVTFSFGPSSGLVNQLDAGAPGDVLATADEITMGQAVKAGSVAQPAVFTCNRLALIVPQGNPRHLRSLTDLGRKGVDYVVCAAPVPCGRFARQALEKVHVDAKPLGSEQDAKAVVAKVVIGEADAGIAYVTDAGGAPGKVDAVPLPAAQQEIASYPIAVVSHTGARPLAQAFVAFVRSKAGQAVLAEHGFRGR